VSGSVPLRPPQGPKLQGQTTAHKHSLTVRADAWRWGDGLEVESRRENCGTRELERRRARDPGARPPTGGTLCKAGHGSAAVRNQKPKKSKPANSHSPTRKCTESPPKSKAHKEELGDATKSSHLQRQVCARRWSHESSDSPLTKVTYNRLLADEERRVATAQVTCNRRSVQGEPRATTVVSGSTPSCHNMP
jgi:hypothetical protein